MQQFSKNISLFPGKEWLNHPVVEQTEYLVDGEFKQWDGDFKKVFSAIKVNNNDVLEDIYLGKIPNGGLNEAMECLDAAEKAYDNGFGYWPTLSVEERIKHVEKFIKEMIGLREEVVQLLMREIGKYRADSEK